MEEFASYVHKALKEGAFAAVEISPSAIVTAPWPAMKCRYGCPNYGHNRSCPPFAPGYEYMRKLCDSYSRALIIGTRDMHAGRELARELMQRLIKDGYYKAVAFGSGPCDKCAVCTPANCPTPWIPLPTPEACGVDVFATARAAGLPVKTTMSEGDLPYCYSIILVE